MASGSGSRASAESYARLCDWLVDSIPGWVAFVNSRPVRPLALLLCAVLERRYGPPPDGGRW